MPVLSRPKHVPGAQGHVARAELSTPLSTQHFVNQEHGEAYGLGHTPARFRLRSLGPRTPIEHLYLTGADVALCGVMGAMARGALRVRRAAPERVWRSDEEVLSVSAGNGLGDTLWSWHSS